jgi:transcriptional regulator with XRE-family HTH domain
MSDSPTNREQIAAEVRAALARKRPKMTQGELAERIGISRVALSERLNGYRPFDVDQLYRISDALDVPFMAFFGGEAA